MERTAGLRPLRLGRLVGLVLSLALVAGALAIPASIPAPANAAPSSPNIIFILTDDQTIGTMKAMPAVTSLIRDRGVNYTQAYISNPVCCPSRASILTGQYSKTNQVYTNQFEIGFGEGKPWIVHGGAQAFHNFGGEDRSIAALLDEHGYHTGLFGKYLNHYERFADTTFGDGSRGSGAGWKPPGWDRWVAFYHRNAAYYDYDLNVDGTLVHRGTSATDHSNRVLGDEAVRFILERPADQPFFLYLAPYAGHGPNMPEPRDLGRFAGIEAYDSPAVGENTNDKPSYMQTHRRRYGRLSAANRARLYETLYGLDRQVRRILSTLSPAEMQNTIVVFMSDNGIANGEHNWGSKLVPYERVIHVPLFMRWDGHLPAGVEREGFALNIDIAPTLLHHAGVPVPEVDGGILPVARDRFLLETMFYPSTQTGSVPTYCGIVTTRWKYVVYSPNGFEPDLVAAPFEDELYHRTKDPWELTNVASERPRTVTQLRAALAKLCSPPPPGTTAAWFDAWAPG